MNNSIQRRKRQIKKYTSHAIAPCVAKHFLYTFVICRLTFAAGSCRNWKNAQFFNSVRV